jgi:hypothetical protein
LRAYQRRTLAAEALIAGAYLAGVNTRRVRRALAALFSGAVGKDIVSRTWRKVKGDWDVWNSRSLADEPIVRVILDGTVVRVRLSCWASRPRNLRNQIHFDVTITLRASACLGSLSLCRPRQKAWGPEGRPRG